MIERDIVDTLRGGRKTTASISGDIDAPRDIVEDTLERLAAVGVVKKCDDRLASVDVWELDITR